MAESIFIKSTMFGGYDKQETDKVLESLITEVYELKNKLKSSDLFAKGTKEDDIVAKSAAELAKVQAENETLKRNNEDLKAQLAAKDEQITALNDEIKKNKDDLKEANNKLSKVADGEAAMLSKVFIEAQKSAEMVVNDARRQADDLKSDSEKLAENMVIEANNKAAKIVYAAEKQAAEIEAKAVNDDEAMKAASSNMKAVMLTDIEAISSQLAKIKELFESLKTDGTDKIQKSETILKDAEKALKKDGVPKFKVPEEIAADMPKEPKLGKPDYNYANAKDKASEERNEELEKLMSMAQSIASDDDKKAAPKKEEKKADKGSDGGLDLDALAKLAESL